MHPIEQICSEYNITRYKLAKDSTVSEMALLQLIKRNTAVGNIKSDTLFKISLALNLNMTQLYLKLKKFEEIEKKG